MSHPPCYTRRMNKQLKESEAALNAELARNPHATIQHVRELRRAMQAAHVVNERLLTSPMLKPLA